MSDKKRQDLPAGLWPGLWVVATPIGNLADLGERARQALEAADAVLCEDTRRTSQLLAALGLSKSMERLDAHAAPAKLAKLTERLAAGENFALVSDAGTPGISDPGAALVRVAAAAGVRVVPVPGASAVAALLSVCGFEETAFTFRGFFPRKTKEQESELAEASASVSSRVFIWYESPQRIADSLELVASRAPDAELVVAKELTKLHERVFRGKSGEVLEQVRSEIAAQGARGEWSFAARFEESSERGNVGSEWVKALQCLLNARVPASVAAREVSQQFGVPKNEVYARAIAKKDE